MFEIKCHCGNIQIEAAKLPDSVTSCNCSICRRYGARWAYYDESEIAVTRGSHSISTYQWLNKRITFHSCGNCSSVMYHSCLGEDGTPRVGINSRMAEPEISQEIPVRLFDGADTWGYINE
jgi:hypothetical protein